MRAMLVLVGLLTPAAVLADSCAGRSVFLDQDGNGVRDAGEHGIAGVRVSDGVRVASTDAAGRFALDSATDQGLFLVKPAGYAAPMRADGLPDTWRKPADPDCRDFALAPAQTRSAEPLRVLLFGDPQPKTMVDVGHYERDIIAPLRNRHQARLAISLGDLVDDDLSLYPALKSVDASLAVPWLHAPGNHDIDPRAASDELSLAGFRDAFGPDTYAWEEPEANFVVFDDVIHLPGPKPGYVGGLRERQFAFLADYLAGADKKRLLVLSMHIPLFDTTAGVETFRHVDRARLFALLQPFPHVLILSAHSHKQRHYLHGADTGWQGGKPLHEYNVGAACGAFWSGAPDAEGIPAATMSDGTPNGYAELSTRGGDYQLRWQVARAPADYQIALHAPKVLRRGAYPAYGVYANVFMGRDDTRVEYRVDAGGWQPMKKVVQPDPGLLAENALDNQAPSLRGFDRSPEAAPSMHLWRGVVPADLAAGPHRIEVRAQLNGADWAQAAIDYRLDEWSGHDPGK